MDVDLQPILQGDLAILSPLTERDFDELYAVAADPLIWEQHPNKDRWKLSVFRTFFGGACLSGGAFKVVDPHTRRIMGSTRFYDYARDDSSILIGYTFYGRAYWGTGVNRAVKRMMLDYIFQYVSDVFFHVGSVNIRSQKAMERLGALKVGEQEVAYFGEAPKHNFVYRISKLEWEEGTAGGEAVQ